MIQAVFLSEFMRVSHALLLGVYCSSAPLSALELFVSPAGQPDAAGTQATPLTLAAAIKRSSQLLKREGLPEAGVTVTLAGGRYAFDQRFQLGAEFTGEKDRPIVFRAADGERVVFDGSVEIDSSRFLPVSDEVERGRLAAQAADHVRVVQLQDTRLTSALDKKLMLNLSIGGQLYLPSVYPNSGYAQLAAETTVPEMSPPAVPLGEEAYQVRAGKPPYHEKGKPFGWRGSLTDPRGASVGFDPSSPSMAGTWLQWQAELERSNRRNALTGFTDANWLLSSQPIHSASEETQTIRLSKALGYGWGWRKNDKPFRVFGMLCELDQPGEWHYDPTTKKLYVYPVMQNGKALPVRLPVATDFFIMKETSHVSVIGLSVENLAGGVGYQIVKGRHNLIASCRVGSSVATGMDISGKHNAVKGCDFVDLDRHIRLNGGWRSAKEIVEGHNEVSNCHFYQKSVKHQKVNILVRGVGNRFVGNLIHNSLGQAVVIHGNDHLLERNELFNVGFDEGDGGAMYSGGDLTGYGITYRHNFFHHLMHVPGKVPRSGIHLDDRQAGAICIGNIFYKSAEKGIHMNGGAGHVLRDNIFLEGARGIYNTSGQSQKMYDLQEAILADRNHPHVRTKENYVGRAERVVGKEGWSKEPWKSRYPLFHQVMADAGQYGRMWPIRCVVENNFYYQNTGMNRTVWSRMESPALAKIQLDGDRDISPQNFSNYEALDLRLTGEGMPDIPFQDIGLTLDEYRSEMPDKAHYRKAVKAFFKDESSMPGTNRRLDTAQIVEEKVQTTP